MDSTSTRRNVYVQKNPLELTPVIKCVLKYLNMADLKNCRYISKEWSSTALVEIKRRGKIVFKYGDCDEDDDSDWTPARLYEDFSNNLSIPFIAYQFEAKWKLTELKSFFQSHKNILHEFYIKDVELYDDKNEVLESFDITPFISDSPMTRPNTKRSTKLSVDTFIGTEIVVQISSLIHVKKIKLYNNCQLALVGKVKPRPLELKLSNIEVVRNGDKVTDVSLNDMFDFSNSKKIKISCMDDLNLSFSNAVKLEYLDFKNCVIKKWGICRLSVKKLVWHDIPFIERTEMQIKELEFCGSKIDFFFLSKSLETLSVSVSRVPRERDFFASQLVNLPNLKSLRLNVVANLSEMISHFVHSPLVELDLGLLEQYLTPLEINFNSIPKSVKKLKLRQVTVNIQDGDSPLNLDKLVLEKYPYHGNTVRDLISSHFKTTELVIVGQSNGIQVGLDVLGFLLYDKMCLDCNQRFYIGPFNWSRQLFGNSPLIHYVDKEAEYYLFENGMGKAVGRNEFKELETVYNYSK